VLKWARAHGCPWDDLTCSLRCSGRAHGSAPQVEAMEPTLQAPGSKRLKLESEELLANFGFKFNLRRYNMDVLKWARANGCEWDRMTW